MRVDADDHCHSSSFVSSSLTETGVGTPDSGSVRAYVPVLSHIPARSAGPDSSLVSQSTEVDGRRVTGMMLTLFAIITGHQGGTR